MTCWWCHNEITDKEFVVTRAPYHGKVGDPYTHRTWHQGCWDANKTEET